MDSKDQYLKPKTVLGQLNISYSTLLRRVKRCEIPYIKVGSQLRFPSSYIQSLSDASSDHKEISHE
jgi:excisionase family DNA binding protein